MMRFKGKVAHKFAESPLLELRLPAWRSRLMALLILFSFVVLIGRAFYLQILDTDFLQEKGESRYRRDIEITASRGRIADRHGDVLAISTPMRSIWAVPPAAQLTSEQTQHLAALLEIDAQGLARKLTSDKPFVFLRRQIPPPVAAQVAALKLPGIGQDKEYRRFYPTGEMTAHMVGFTGVDDKGLEGAELAFHGQLLGTPGSRSVIKDRRGQIVEDVGSVKPPQDGEDISLALDSKVQYLAYSQLKQAIADSKAKAGGIVVLDARTGEILALANWPTYNPNNRESLSGGQLRNRALTDTFEPGSTLKPFTIALAMDTGKVRFDTQINCAPGRLQIGGATISDTHRYGVLTVAEVIQKSSNVGSSKIAAMLPAQAMWEMFHSVGFGEVPRLGFPGEVSGRLRPWKSWRPIEQATMSFGHGLSVSLIQLARAYSVFARDGDLVPLSLTRVGAAKPRGTQVFSPQTAREVRAMLEMAVRPGGTAPKAQIPGYRVAGKTGTARKLENGRYTTTKYVASFVGFAPASDPRLIVAVLIDEPRGKYYGGEVAAPVFASVMAGTLRTLGIAPDAPLEVAQGAKPAVKARL
ncbi:MAG: Penicillin-binding protein 2 [Candidatus Accumulibacter regalis]|jgi:cell division protein FtsI (penicillin-binding protein 3)|uniref:Peptidoglycan D,D-transpeptidase FtsI n=1 Tax=Accumulibacter regalis TaxID=522306 RepID=A0A011R5X1_ACCRE|nr:MULTISPECIES: penicillin-binding protein 2 [unclassified Candidatus Accumulibacter]EXI86519.1 MAG: Penicillin-binding protein 2 [Candidatus Accumulibacter regalis]MQM35089.1 penicillin-binding protein 2 [Candidatus Accumulibacter phosphatis]MBL8369463.1 penicillin-binding protein 2 [Accumulibacter sp.]MBN8515216.1 penicillin-binding protein 2 [Accumulibacter sp.]MBO3701634.1 penicillin-binding protein 2 [Accumulibacter sp.]